MKKEEGFNIVKSNYEDRYFVESELSKESIVKEFTYRFVKRLMDIVISAIGLISLFPLFVIIAVAMKISEPTGPIFFSHVRNGKDGKKFKMYKFRSMCVNAEEKLRSDPILYEKFVQNGYKLFEGEDPRITKLGLVLRKLSLDELPQFINVFLGSMSLVGPRPIPDKEIEEYGYRRELFLSVKPGITGWWQVSGRSNVSYPERCDLELEYVEKKSLVLDIKIFVKTFTSVLKKDGAY